MRNPLRYTIASKLFLPIAILVFSSISFIYFVWIPNYVEFTISALTAQIDKTILSVSEGIIPLVLENKLSAVYATLDIVLKDNPRWIDLQLHDSQGRSIYPLIPSQISDPSFEKRVISREINTGGANLGMISVIYDFSKLIKDVQSQSYELFSVISFLIVVFALAIGLLLQFLIVRPVNHLKNASDALAGGNYEVKLPRPTRDEIGHLVRSFDAMRNQIKFVQDELLEASTQAKAASETKSAFLANMSHEIRTPMNGILGLADVLIEEAETPELRESLEIIRRSSSRLLNLLNEVLDISKIEAGTFRIKLETADIVKVCSDEVMLFQAAAAAKNVDLSFSVNDAPACVRIDPVRVQQVLSNLISNAIKFTSDGFVRVTLTVERSSEEPRLIISVKDSGIGISEEDHDKVFLEFIQVGRSQIGSNKGTGLGLAICRKVVDLMGGTIKLQSQLGHGSEFVVKLPFKKEVHGISHKPESPSHRYTSVSRGIENHRLHVLLVDDDEINRSFGQKMLHHLGVERVDVLETGEKVVEMLENETYDLIFMDCQMPVVNGFEATQRVREMEERNSLLRTPIIAITAKAMAGDREKCMEAGMDGYMVKPIRRKEVIRILEKFGNGKGAGT